MGITSASADYDPGTQLARLRVAAGDLDETLALLRGLCDYTDFEAPHPSVTSLVREILFDPLAGPLIGDELTYIAGDAAPAVHEVAPVPVEVTETGFSPFHRTTVGALRWVLSAVARA